MDVGEMKLESWPNQRLVRQAKVRISLPGAQREASLLHPCFEVERKESIIFDAHITYGRRQWS
jgi:hypothetical protein